MLEALVEISTLKEVTREVLVMNSLLSSTDFVELGSPVSKGFYFCMAVWIIFSRADSSKSYPCGLEVGSKYIPERCQTCLVLVSGPTEFWVYHQPAKSIRLNLPLMLLPNIWQGIARPRDTKRQEDWKFLAFRSFCFFSQFYSQKFLCPWLHNFWTHKIIKTQKKIIIKCPGNRVEVLLFPISFLRLISPSLAPACLQFES